MINIADWNPKEYLMFEKERSKVLYPFHRVFFTAYKSERAYINLSYMQHNDIRKTVIYFAAKRYCSIVRFGVI